VLVDHLLSLLSRGEREGRLALYRTEQRAEIGLQWYFGCNADTGGGGGGGGGYYGNAM